MSVRVSIIDTPFDPEASTGALRVAAPHAGAFVSFIGQVRDYAEDANVSSLTLQHYPGFTERRIAELIEQARARWPLEACHIVHRVGEILPGEAIVFVGIGSAHRRAAFEAADFLMDHLKSDTPFWKKERRGAEEIWIEPRREDYADKARWAETEDNR